MPAGFFHTTFSSIFTDPRLCADGRAALAEEPVYARLGAMLPDLPYYHNLAFKALSYSLGKKTTGSSWAHLVHGDSPGEFFARFIEACHQYPGPLSRNERLALVLGLASHEGADSAIHPLVNWCADRDQAEKGGLHSHHHVMAEKHQSLFFHLERFGEDVVGSRTLWEQSRVTKKRSWVRLAAEAPVVEIVRTAFELTHGASPSSKEVARWIRAFSHFGLAMSSMLARRDSMKFRGEEIKRRYYRNESFDFDDFFEAAKDYAIELGNLATEYFELGDFSDRARAAFVASADLDPHIGAPSGRRCPPLPRAA